jgi:glutamine synthetase
MESIFLEYIWIDGGGELRSKTMVKKTEKYKEYTYPWWNYDGSSTGQSTGANSDVLLKPVAVYADPFRTNGKLLLCETYLDKKTPHPTNTRHACVQTAKLAESHDPWFGIEQEYFIFDRSGEKPIGWLEKDGGQGKYYCGVGTGNVNCREFVEEHLQLCLKAGLKIAGTNMEVAPGQAEFQTDPLPPVEVGDNLWMMRYILHRLSEKYGYVISLHPKPLYGNWNGSGGHTNISTNKIRKEGLPEIYKAIDKLSKTHSEHMKVYGTGNELRMSGEHETSDYDKFSYGASNRGSSIRIPKSVMEEDATNFYFEDRRPASSLDPYLVTERIVRTLCLSLE